jgi:hypothetical protein
LLILVVLLFLLIFVLHIHIHLGIIIIDLHHAPLAARTRSSFATERTYVGLERLPLALCYAHAFAVEPVVAYIAGDHEYLLVVRLATQTVESFLLVLASSLGGLIGMIR